MLKIVSRVGFLWFTWVFSPAETASQAGLELR
jgi:hypothetical protein